MPQQKEYQSTRLVSNLSNKNMISGQFSSYSQHQVYVYKTGFSLFARRDKQRPCLKKVYEINVTRLLTLQAILC